MPSPIAHSATGYFLYRWMFRQKQSTGIRKGWTVTLWYCIFVAISPDLDFVPQLLTGEKYHHTVTHSINFALIFALVSGLIGCLFRKKMTGIILLTLVIYSSHLFLDFFTEGGKGIQLFWPFSEMLYISPVSLFPGTHYSKGLFNISHLSFVFFEVIYTIALLAVLRFSTQTK